jgi:hypothetical protein
LDLEQVAALAFSWPALTGEEKKSRSLRTEGFDVTLGESKSIPNENLNIEIAKLRFLSLKFIWNRDFQPQYSPNLVRKRLANSAEVSLGQISKSFLALYASSSIAGELIDQLPRNSSGRDLYRNLLIRRAAQLRSANNQIQKGDSNNFLDDSASFMDYAGLDFMDIQISKEERTKFARTKTTLGGKVITLRTAHV